ncbi:protein of unknown function [Clostridium beijerinckii]|nr:protein of unknown function [Clostridium beijerinckii]
MKCRYNANLLKINNIKIKKMKKCVDRESNFMYYSLCGQQLE